VFTTSYEWYSTYPDQDKSTENLSSYFFNINVNIIFASSGLFPANFPTNTLYTFHFSPMRATFLDYDFLYALMFLIIFGNVYEI